MAGVTGITRGSVDLANVPNTPPGELWRYGGGGPFQVGPHLAAFFCAVWVEGKGSIDFTNGSDLILLDDLSDIDCSQAIPMSRNESGDSTVTVKGTVRCGFVPLGARLEDGCPHPHAGTGFGLAYALLFQLDQDGHYDYREPKQRWLEFDQFAYDGKEFRVLHKERVEYETLLPGWEIGGEGLPNAIPDGPDLLLSMVVRSGEGMISGVARWKHGPDGWRPASFVPVTVSRTGDRGRWEGGGEPSLIRDADGSLLLTARSVGEAIFDIAVWRSMDRGETWEQIVYRKDCRSRSPISINRAADGTPYIAANLPANCRTRDILALWPLNEDRTDLGERVIARDARAELGFAPSGSWWRVDHPRSAVVRLADGAWHSVLLYQVVDNLEIEGDADRAPQTGLYVEEIFSEGEVLPEWEF